MKICSRCKKEKNEFWKDSSSLDGLAYYCKDCSRENAKLNARKKYKENPDKYRKQALISYWKHRDKRMLKNKEYEQGIRTKVLEHYGKKCACCGEKEKRFLTLDHINGGGNKQRREMKWNGRHIYRWIVKSNYPAEFRILCFNCNSGRALNHGICPHVEKK